MKSSKIYRFLIGLLYWFYFTMPKNKIGIKVLTTVVLLSIFISSCNSVNDPVIKPIEINPIGAFEDINCDSLIVGIINKDLSKIKSEINKLTTDLMPKISSNDKYGHNENLSTLIARLNSQCSSISAELLCYACIYTNPPQSDILVYTDTSGFLITRVIDIWTSPDTNLSCVRIH